MSHTPLYFAELFTIALTIPIAMLLLFRIWPLLRGRAPVRWVYCLPFVAMLGLLLAIAVATLGAAYVLELDRISTAILAAIVLVEIVLVVVTVHLLPDADANAISRWASRVLIHRHPIIVAPKRCSICGEYVHHCPNCGSALTASEVSHGPPDTVDEREEKQHE